MTIPGSADNGTMIADLARFDLAKSSLWNQSLTGRGRSVRVAKGTVGVS